jgi:hypothetical protein
MQGSCFIGGEQSQLVQAVNKTGGPNALLDLAWGPMDLNAKEAQLVLTRATCPQPTIRYENQPEHQRLRVVGLAQPDINTQLLAGSLLGILPQDSGSARLLNNMSMVANVGFCNLEKAVPDRSDRDKVIALCNISRTMVRGFRAGGAPTPGESQLESTMMLVAELANGGRQEEIDKGREMMEGYRLVNLRSRQGVGHGVVTRVWYNNDPIDGEMFADPMTGEEQLINALHNTMDDQSITIIFRRPIEYVRAAEAIAHVFVSHKHRDQMVFTGTAVRGVARGRRFNSFDFGLVAVKMSEIADVALGQRR